MMLPLYRIGAIILAPICKFCGIKILGKENIPQGEIPLVVVGNHTSYTDPIIVGCAFLPRQVYFVAKSEFKKKFLIGSVFEKLGAIFVDRGEADLSAIKKSVNVLKNNNILGIFAEGKRYKGEGLTDFKQGPVFIAYRGEAAILPVGIKNAQNLFRFWKRDTVISIGMPIYIDKSEGKPHDIMDSYTERVKEAVADLI